jgi:hypothetical protein
MRIIDTTTGNVLGTITTNHSMALHESCELCNVDLDEHDIEKLRLSVYEESDEIEGAEKCARDSVESGLVAGKIPEYDEGAPMIHVVANGWMMDGDDDWLRDKFGFVTTSMRHAYSASWNARLAQAAE